MSDFRIARFSPRKTNGNSGGLESYKREVSLYFIQDRSFGLRYRISRFFQRNAKTVQNNKQQGLGTGHGYYCNISPH